jgi:hypothetical protein
MSTHRTRSTLLSCWLAVGCSSSVPAPGVEAVDSASGALHVVARTVPNPPTRGTIEVDLEITDSATGSPRDGLTLAVTPWMPSMDHGTSLVPTVAPQGQGLYDVTNVDLFMSGTWDLNLAVSGPLLDNAVLQFSIP